MPGRLFTQRRWPICPGSAAAQAKIRGKVAAARRVGMAELQGTTPRWRAIIRMVTRRRWLLLAIVAVLLAEMAVAMVSTAVAQTPTVDEPVYVGTATVYA